MKILRCLQQRRLRRRGEQRPVQTAVENGQGAGAGRNERGIEKSQVVEDAPLHMATQPVNTSLEDVGDTQSRDVLCQRCKDIDIIALLETKNTRSCADFEQVGDSRDNDAKTLRVNLGPYQNLSFDPICPLCKLLLALLPECPRDPEGDIYLIPARSLHRLESDVSMVQYEQERKYANLLFLGQTLKQGAQEGEDQRLEYCHEASDAAGRVFSSEFSEAMPTLQVNSSSVDMALVNRWLNHCTEKHEATCEVKWFSELESMRLIDVYSREVVQYPVEGDRQYLCLSYVWGTDAQSVQKSGSKLQNVPAVIEDAMTFVRSIKKRYLWVDSVS